MIFLTRRLNPLMLKNAQSGARAPFFIVVDTVTYWWVTGSMPSYFKTCRFAVVCDLATLHRVSFLPVDARSLTVCMTGWPFFITGLPSLSSTGSFFVLTKSAMSSVIGTPMALHAA